MSVLYGLHGLAVEPALDLEALAAGRQLVGGDHPGTDTAGAVEILAHAPLRGVALEFAHRALIGAGIAGDAVSAFSMVRCLARLPTTTTISAS